MRGLRVRLPDGRAGDGGPVAWALPGRRGGIRATGVCAPDGLPPARGAVLLAPATRVTVVSAVLPPVRGARLEALLPHLVEEAVADDPAGLRVVPMRPRPGRETALLIVEREWIDAWVRVLAARRVAAARAVPEWLTLPRVEGAWSFSTSGRGGLLRTGAAGGAAIEPHDGRVPPPGLLLALEAARRDGKLPDRILFTPAAEAADTAPPAWMAAVDIPVAVGPVWDWRTAPVEPGADLLAPFRADGFSRGPWRAARPGIAAGAAALALHALAAGADWHARLGERDRVRAEMREILESAVPGTRHVVDPAFQLSRALEAARRAGGRLATDDFLALAGALAQTGAGSLPGAVRALRYRDGVLELEMGDTGPEETRRWTERLASRGLAVRVSPERGQQTRVVIGRRRA